MKTKLQITALSLGLAVLLGLMAWLFFFSAFPSTPDQDKIADNAKKAAEKRAEAVNELKDQEPEETEPVAVELEEADKGGLIKFKENRFQSVEEEFPLDLTENDIQQAIHAMSHQKVRANEKWTVLPLTEERIDRLLEVVAANESKYKKEDAYLRILESWKAGDFSEVDLHHNTIWAFQQGTVGAAYGIMTKEEELEFIKKHLDVELE